MSLQAKIEAIIYASEEPVTLAQLFGLLGEEAAAELDARAALQASLPLTPAAVAGSETDADTPVPPASEPEARSDETLTGNDETPEPPTGPAGSPAASGDSLATPGDNAGSGSAGPNASSALSEEPSAARDEVGAGSAAETAESFATPVDAEDSDLSLNTSEAEEEPSADPARDKQIDEKQLQRAARERDRAVRELLREHLDNLVREYRDGDRGLEIREVASGFRLATRPEYHDTVRGFARSLKPPLKLSLQALETLAVVAYKQPVTAPEVAEIRGVDSAGVLGSLASRKLVTTAGRKAVVGRPILYKTTKEFLLRFGLRDLNELPSIEEFERLAGELADPHQEEIPMPAPPQSIGSTETVTEGNLREEENATEPQADGSGAVAAQMGIPVDGRISGPPPTTDAPIDSPAGDAAIQSGEETEYAAENGTED